MDKIPKQTTTTLNGKTVMEEQYGFSIIDTPIKITETDETIAYNLLVKSDTITEGNYFENLLINIDKQTNLTKAYLVKYNLEDTNLVYTNHNSFLFNGTRSAREIVYNNNPVRTFGKETSGACITYQILMCSYQGLHVAGPECIRENFDLLSVQTQTSGDCSNGVDPIDTSGGVGGTTSSGGTTSNGNTNDGSTTVIDNPTPLCDTCIELTPELSDFLADLSTEQLDYWNNLEYVNKRSIVSYLVQNNYSIESVAFVKEALIALNEGGKVDFNNEIILDSSFVNNQKANCVYHKLLTLSNESYFKDIIVNAFDSNDKANVKFVIANLPQNTATGSFDAATLPSYPNIFPGNSLFTIYLDTNFVNNASNIEIALTLIHELMHAELFQRCIELGIISSMVYNQNYDGVFYFNNGSNFSTFEPSAFLNAMIQSYLNYPNPSQWTHNLMTGLNYNNIITQNLLEAYPILNDPNFDFLTNINNDVNNLYGNFTLQNALNYLSWRGLEETQSYQNLIQNITNELNKKNYIEVVSRTKFSNSCN